YDVFLLVASIPCIIYLLSYPLTYVSDNIHILLLIFSGFTFPILLWTLQKKYIEMYRAGFFNVFFTITSAISEEIIWRGALIAFLQHTGLTLYYSLLFSSIGFLMLHIPIMKIKKSLYLLLFTLILVIIFWFLDIIAAIVFHVFHNLALQIFKPIQRIENRGPVSKEW
ncbi:CPBP family glutamic-type intramembrane protease, partial [Staphylococcus pseudintermedius]|uniref:CPBP family glutamic-type intramembrane protease n=1 Tax=Staphylococcus pseudintermedius TaxID=283734 RepID=UPI0035C1DF5B